MPIYFGMDLSGWIVMLIGTILTVSAEIYVNSSYRKYKEIQNKSQSSGFEVARKILDMNGLEDVHIVETNGILSDHYDPKRKVIRLSHDIFHGTTIAASSVAAHEVGHAIQHKDNYLFIRIRSFLIPFINFSSHFGYLAILIGLFFDIINLAWVGVGLLTVILVFQLVTLPVEFDASKRAKEQLEKYQLLDQTELRGSSKMLHAAAYTYVAGLATTVLELLRLVLIVASRDDR